MATGRDTGIKEPATLRRLCAPCALQCLCFVPLSLSQSRTPRRCWRRSCARACTRGKLNCWCPQLCKFFRQTNDWFTVCARQSKLLVPTGVQVASSNFQSTLHRREFPNRLQTDRRTDGQTDTQLLNRQPTPITTIRLSYKFILSAVLSQNKGK